MSLQKLLAKEVLIRLTDSGFVSTVRYAGLCAKSSSWITRCSSALDEVKWILPAGKECWHSCYLNMLDRCQPCRLFGTMNGAGAKPSHGEADV